VGDVRRLWTDTSRVALDAASDLRIGRRWSDPSSLPDMSIGDLVGHLLHSGIILLEESLDLPVPAGEPMTTAVLFSIIPFDADDDIHGNVRKVAAAHGDGGQVDLLARAAACRERLVTRLAAEPPERVVGPAVSGSTISWGLDDFIAARILELVVHFDDLIASVDLGEVKLPTPAVALTCHLGIDIAMRRHGPASVMRALYRSDRNSPDALRPL
jgi:hypothetical protein